MLSNFPLGIFRSVIFLFSPYLAMNVNYGRIGSTWKGRVSSHVHSSIHFRVPCLVGRVALVRTWLLLMKHWRFCILKELNRCVQSMEQSCLISVWVVKRSSLTELCVYYYIMLVLMLFIIISFNEIVKYCTLPKSVRQALQDVMVQPPQGNYSQNLP